MFGKFDSTPSNGRGASNFNFLILCLVASLIVPSMSWAQAKKKTLGQKALVQTDGAAVYEKANFDSKVLQYLNEGQEVVISRKRVKGAGGFGSFFRIKLKNKKTGFIADVDVIPEFKKGQSRKKVEKNPVFNEIEEQRNQPEREPFYFSRYLGGGYGYVGYSEKFSGKTFSSNESIFSIKFTGPGVLFDGPPFDLNVGFSPFVPDYYNKFSSAAPTGFFLLGEFMPILPLLERNNGLLYYGLGLMWTYTRFKVQVRNSTFDSQELRAGIVGNLGYGHRFDKMAVRAEVKYYFEKTQYFGYWLNIQFPY